MFMPWILMYWIFRSLILWYFVVRELIFRYFIFMSLILRYFVSALRYSSEYRIEAQFDVPHGDTVQSTAWRYSSAYCMEEKTMWDRVTYSIQSIATQLGARNPWATRFEMCHKLKWTYTVLTDFKRWRV